MGQAKVPKELYVYFERTGSLKRYQPGEMIYMQGESGGRLYLVRQGRVRAFYTEGEKELTFEIIERGRMFGESSFLAHSLRPVCVAAVNQVELISCGIDGLYAAMEESPELMRIILGLLSNTCNHLTEQLRRITMYDCRQKIASLLLWETQNPDRDRGVTKRSIPYTQEELAMALGLNRVSVNRVLGQWKREGAVATAYGKIEILDREYLENVVGGVT